MQKNVITLVKDFTKFKFMDENRVIDKITSKRMKSLKAAILKGVYMPPVLIDTDYQILDGQHRVTAAMSLIKEGEKVGLSVLMIDPIDTNQTSIEIARTLNSTQKKWTISDYEQSFVNEGKDSYAMCAQLTSFAFKEFGIKLPISAKKLLLNISPKHDSFKSGNIKVTEEDYNTAICILQEFFNCSDNSVSKMQFSVAMIGAFIYIRLQPGYDAVKFQEYFEEFETEFPDAGANISSFIALFKTVLEYFE